MASLTDSRPDPDALLAQLQEAQATQQRGKLRIYFGANAGVGKTYAMLSAAQLAGLTSAQLANLGTDDLEQRLFKTLLVGSTLGGGDDVDEALHLGFITGAPTQRNVHSTAALYFSESHISIRPQDRNGLREVTLA